MRLLVNIIEKLHKSRKLIKDFSLNIFASFSATAIIQIVVYPWLASCYSSEMYGLLLTVMGVCNLLVTAVGNSLNNLRLIMNSDYEREKKEGDFLPLLAALNLITVILFCVYALINNVEYSVYTITLLIVYVVLGNMRGYGIVTYRLKLNFAHNLICSLSVAFGNLIGLFIFLYLKRSALWPLTFVCGELAGLIVIYSNSSILRESFKTTPFFRTALWKCSILIVTSIIANILIYLDRLLLLPVLGGEAVATYTTASFFGKCLGLVFTPMAGVLLGYYSQNNFAMSKKLFRKTNALMIGIAVIFFVISLFCAKWFTGILYPKLIDGAVPYLVIANLALIVNSVSSMTQPAILRFAPLKWQTVIQITYCFIYLIGGYYGAKHFGLFGFSVAALSASIIRLIVLYIIGEMSLKDDF